MNQLIELGLQRSGLERREIRAARTSGPESDPSARMGNIGGCVMWIFRNSAAVGR